MTGSCVNLCYREGDPLCWRRAAWENSPERRTKVSKWSLFPVPRKPARFRLSRLSPDSPPIRVWHKGSAETASGVLEQGVKRVGTGGLGKFRGVVTGRRLTYCPPGAGCLADGSPQTRHLHRATCVTGKAKRFVGGGRLGRIRLRGGRKCAIGHQLHQLIGKTFRGTTQVRPSRLSAPRFPAPVHFLQPGSSPTDRGRRIQRWR